MTKSTEESRPVLVCSFCGKTRGEVRQLIRANADGAIAICDECVRLSCEIVSHLDETEG